MEKDTEKNVRLCILFELDLQIWCLTRNLEISSGGYLLSARASSKFLNKYNLFFQETR